MNIRKSVNSLNAAEKADYINGVQLLKANGAYDAFVETHVTTPALSAHQGPAFLPWHREYLRRYEKAIQDILGKPDFALPYWDWPVDAALPDPINAPIWQDDFLGGDGSPVSSGPFANWPTIYPNGLLNRALGVGLLQFPNTSQLPTASEVNSALAVTPYDAAPWNTTIVKSFRNQLEGWIGRILHNRGHIWVGGSMTFMSSPNDPVFWLHHCNVDRLWAIWQCQHPSEGYLPISGGPQGHNLNDNMIPWHTAPDLVKPADVLDIRALGYEYDHMVDNSNGNLLHTIRYADTSWQPFLGNIEGQSGERGIFVNTDCSGLSNQLHVCGVTSNGRLWHTFRNSSGSWQAFFGDIESQTGNVGTLVKVACAGSGSKLHVCGITSDGRILHTIRNSNGSWQPFFGDIETQTGESGVFVDLGCDTIGNTLHVCGVTSDGRLLHTIRNSNGSWQPFFGDIETQTGESGVFAQVDCARVGNRLHVCGVTSDGRILHTVRNSNGSWQPFFGDIETQTGESGVFAQVSCEGIGTKLHVCGVNLTGTILHTIRNSNGSWQPFFGNISQQVCKSGSFQDIACGNSGGQLHVCIIS